MERVSVEAVTTSAVGGDVDRRGLSEPLGTTDVAINHYRLAPGERISSLHTHLDQEEVFIVVEGEATFETLAARSGGITTEREEVGGDAREEDDGGAGEEVVGTGEEVVGAGEAIRFAPGDFQSCKNASDDDAVVYALGAPHDSDEVRIPLTCSECGHDDMRPEIGADGEEVLVCPDCGVESEAACPECGQDDVRAILAADGERAVAFCPDCGSESRL